MLPVVSKTNTKVAAPSGMPFSVRETLIKKQHKIQRNTVVMLAMVIGTTVEDFKRIDV